MVDKKLYTVKVEFVGSTEVVVLAADEDDAEHIAENCASSSETTMDTEAYAKEVHTLDDLKRVGAADDEPYVKNNCDNPRRLTCKEILNPPPVAPDPPNGQDYHCAINYPEKWQKVKGWRVEIPGMTQFHMFAHHKITRELNCQGPDWSISEATSGQSTSGWYGPTMAEVITATTKWTSEHAADIVRMPELIVKVISQSGESPGYPGKTNDG